MIFQFLGYKILIRAAEKFAENMVINNAILWELNELVGNLRPELHTHIRLAQFVKLIFLLWIIQKTIDEL